MATIDFQTTPTSVLEAVARRSSMWYIALAQFSLSPFLSCDALRALTCVPNLTTAAAISPTPCLDLPSGRIKAFLGESH